MRSCLFQSFCFRELLIFFLFFHLVFSFVHRSFFSTSYVWGNVSHVLEKVYKIHELYQRKLAEAETESKGLMEDQGQLVKLYELYQEKLAGAKVEAEKKIKREEGGIHSLYKLYEEKLAEAEAEAKRLMGDQGQIAEVYRLYQGKIAVAEAEAKGLIGDQVQPAKVYRLDQWKIKDAKVEAEKEIEGEEGGIHSLSKLYEEKLAEAEAEARGLIGDQGRIAKVYRLYQGKIEEVKVEVEKEIKAGERGTHPIYELYEKVLARVEKEVKRKAAILLNYEFSVLGDSPDEEEVEAREKIGKGEEGISSIYKFYKNKINEAAVEAELMRLERVENILRHLFQETVHEVSQLKRELMEATDPIAAAAKFPIIESISSLITGEDTVEVKLALDEFYKQKIAEGRAGVEKELALVVEEGVQLIKVYQLYRAKLTEGSVMGELMNRDGMERASKNAHELYEKKLAEAEIEAEGLIMGEKSQLIRVYNLYQQKLEDAETEAEKEIERGEGDILSVYKLYETKLAEAEPEAKRSIGEEGQLIKVYELHQKKLVEVSKLIQMEELLERVLINRFYREKLARAEVEAKVKIGDGDRLTEVYELYQKKISEAEEKVKKQLNKIGEQVFKAHEPSCKGVF